MTRWLGGLACVVFGAVLGALGMRAYLTPVAQQSAPEQVRRAPAPPAPRVELREAPAVWVTLEDGFDARRIPAVLIGDPAVVVLRFADYIRAQRATWTDASGRLHALDTALAINLELGLLAFAHDAPATALPTLVSEDGSLYLGLDVSVHTPAATRAAFVDSAAIEIGQNDYRYRLGGIGALDAPLGAVLDDDDALLGLATLSAGGAWQALDAGTLRRFLDNPLDAPLAPLARVSDYVFAAPLGIAREFDALAATGRWAVALEAARKLAERAPTLLTRSRLERIHEALERQLRALVAAQRAADSRPDIHADLARFGANAVVLAYLFDIHARADGIDSAVALFLRPAEAVFQHVDSALRVEVLRARVMSWLAGPNNSDGAAIGLLRQVLAADDPYAPYHRALGERLFNLGDYAQAAFHLRRATELDPSMRAELARALATAEQRRQVTDAVEVPIEGSGSALYVPVQLNGGQTFRFLLDTGASYSAINTRTLLMLGYSGIFNQGAPVIELDTANGRVFAQTFTLPSMSVGGATVEQVPVVILEDMGPLDGLLGLSFLQHFDVQIDARDQRLILRPR